MQNIIYLLFKTPVEEEDSRLPPLTSSCISTTRCPALDFGHAGEVVGLVLNGKYVCNSRWVDTISTKKCGI